MKIGRTVFVQVQCLCRRSTSCEGTEATYKQALVAQCKYSWFALCDWAIYTTYKIRVRFKVKVGKEGL